MEIYNWTKCCQFQYTLQTEHSSEEVIDIPQGIDLPNRLLLIFHTHGHNIEYNEQNDEWIESPMFDESVNLQSLLVGWGFS